MKFFVEVRTDLGHSTVISRSEQVKDWQEAVNLAKTMSVQMFREDPMASRLFHNGTYVYTNMNDMGDAVSIRPIVAELEDTDILPVHCH